VARGNNFERAGLSAAVVPMDPSVRTGRMMASVQRAPEDEWFSVESPMAVLEPDRVKECARWVQPEVDDWLSPLGRLVGVVSSGRPVGGAGPRRGAAGVTDALHGIGTSVDRPDPLDDPPATA
jgi:hypothetical protein